jgi:hypothetical protein
MPSDYVLQVARKTTGEVVASWPPGRETEKDFVTAICERVDAKGVGVGHTSAHVVADVRAALEEAIFEVKAQVRP